MRWTLRPIQIFIAWIITNLCCTASICTGFLCISYKVTLQLMGWDPHLSRQLYKFMQHCCTLQPGKNDRDKVTSTSFKNDENDNENRTFSRTFLAWSVRSRLANASDGLHWRLPASRTKSIQLRPNCCTLVFIRLPTCKTVQLILAHVCTE